MKIGFKVTRPLMPGIYTMDINPTRQIGIERVIFNDPATIVIWKDGSKTVVKCTNEAYDPEKGLAMAITKKALGNTGSYYSVLRKWLPDISAGDTDGDNLLAEQLKMNIDNNTIKKAFSDFGNNVNSLARLFLKVDPNKNRKEEQDKNDG